MPRARTASPTGPTVPRIASAPPIRSTPRAATGTGRATCIPDPAARLLAFRVARALPRSDRAFLGGRRQVALRPLRPRLGRHGRAEDARVQRRYAHGAAGGERRAVVLAEGREARRRPVQLDPR